MNSCRNSFLPPSIPNHPPMLVRRYESYNQFFLPSYSSAMWRLSAKMAAASVTGNYAPTIPATSVPPKMQSNLQLDKVSKPKGVIPPKSFDRCCSTNERIKIDPLSYSWGAGRMSKKSQRMNPLVNNIPNNKKSKLILSKRPVHFHRKESSTRKFCWSGARVMSE